MNESAISPGWALVAIVLLWALAGALDQPLLDEEPAEALPVEQAKPVASPPVRLLCHVDQDEPQAPWPPSQHGMPQISLVSFRATQGDRHQQPVWPFRSLRCIVIDE
jgi:hypothetical protein